MNDRVNTTTPSRLLVNRISGLMEDFQAVDRELVAAFRRAPSTALFDRVMAFRTFPLEQEFRAAIERLEKGSYGRCTVCGEAIAMSEMLESPLGRYCSHCLRGPGTGADRLELSATDAQDNR